MDIRFKKAVALHYRSQLPAPVVIAKGKGLVADRLIKIAENNKIPIVENTELTNLLYKIDISNYIPEELYKAVAEILLFINKIEKEV
mgnify:CR=1 FL=1